jgi:subtilase family serine protease
MCQTSLRKGGAMPSSRKAAFCGLLAFAMLAAGCSGGGGSRVTPQTGTSSADRATQSANSSGIVYKVSPHYRLALASDAPMAFPFTPSQCVTTFGLACYTPQLIRTGYDVPSSLTGAGRTIVIVDAYGSPTVEHDLKTFDAIFGLPDPPSFKIVYPGGSPAYNPLQTHDESGWAAETSLDVQWSHAIAPSANIVLVVAANNYGNVLNNAVQYAIQHKLGDVISMSYGSDEAAIAGAGNNLQLQQAHANHVAAQQAGITMIASAGDGGASDGFPIANASFPASDPLVTAVGGTNLFLSDTGAYQRETTWDDGDDCPFGCTAGPFGATGGAPSVIFDAASYQQAVSGRKARTTSDVGYNASVYTSVLVYLGFLGTGNNGLYFFGGTSEGAPQWAGITALAAQSAGHSLGLINPKLYAASGAFHDVTVGDNTFGGVTGFSAGVGYDLPTGLGTPDVARVVSALAH